LSYALGVDLGTTYTAAAVCEPKGRPEMVSLGSNSYAVPSVVFLKEDGDFLAGEAAEMRASEDPTRVVRHFKRRLGDEVPFRIGGTPFAAQTLTTHLLQWVLHVVAERRGEPPSTVVLTHPANWGPYRRELFEQAAVAAGSPNIQLLTEPEAAASHYANSERVEPGELIGVYDLGGGTFDAVVVRRTSSVRYGDGFEIVGQPKGVERLGGLDFDDVVWQFVMEAADLLPDEENDKPSPLNSEDPATIAAAIQLRNQCIHTKQLLSFDTTASVHVVFPGISRTVRLNRSEFEQRIMPRLNETVHAFNSALASGGLTTGDLSRILLVGGSSRIPVIAQTLAREFGRPVAVDSDPKNTVALGAARLGSTTRARAGQKRQGPPPRLRPVSAHAPSGGPQNEDQGLRAAATVVDLNAPDQPAPLTLASVAGDLDEIELRDDHPDLGRLRQSDDDRVRSEATAATAKLAGARTDPRPDSATQTDESAASLPEPSVLEFVSPESSHRVRLSQPGSEQNPFVDTDPKEPEEVREARRSLQPLAIVGLLALTAILLVVIVNLFL